MTIEISSCSLQLDLFNFGSPASYSRMTQSPQSSVSPHEEYEAVSTLCVLTSRFLVQSIEKNTEGTPESCYAAHIRDISLNDQRELH